MFVSSHNNEESATRKDPPIFGKVEVLKCVISGILCSPCRQAYLLIGGAFSNWFNSENMHVLSALICFFIQALLSSDFLKIYFAQIFFKSQIIEWVTPFLVFHSSLFFFSFSLTIPLVKRDLIAYSFYFAFTIKSTTLWEMIWLRTELFHVRRANKIYPKWNDQIFTCPRARMIYKGNTTDLSSHSTVLAE